MGDRLGDGLVPALPGERAGAEVTVAWCQNGRGRHYCEQVPISKHITKPATHWVRYRCAEDGEEWEGTVTVQDYEEAAERRARGTVE